MTADFLERAADAEYDEGVRLKQSVEDRERDLVNLRGARDEAFRRAAEMRDAANILREVGLRSEVTAFVEVDYQPKRPDVADKP